MGELAKVVLMQPASAQQLDVPPMAKGRLKRWLLAAMGVLCVGLAAIGLVVPGLPTTIFLIGASGCFVRSCPWLQDKLLHNRLFAPYLRYLDNSAVMPMKARIIAAAMMWSAITLSLAWLYFADSLSAWLALAILSAGVIGSVTIARYRRALSEHGA